MPANADLPATAEKDWNAPWLSSLAEGGDGGGGGGGVGDDFAIPPYSHADHFGGGTISAVEPAPSPPPSVGMYTPQPPVGGFGGQAVGSWQPGQDPLAGLAPLHDDLNDTGV